MKKLLVIIASIFVLLGSVFSFTSAALSEENAKSLYAPAIDSVSPAAVKAGSEFNIRVSGKNFFINSSVQLNGQGLKTRFINSILLEAEVPTQQKGSYKITVLNPAPGNLSSNSKTLTIVDVDSPLPSGAATPAAVSSEKGDLKGRVLNTELQPIEGVTIKVKNLSAKTDAEGYFLLKDIPAGKNLLLLDGSTAMDSEARYPSIPLNVDIIANTVNDLPFQPYFHKQKNRSFVNINPEGDTLLSDPEVPGFEMRIPKGVKIIGWDGQSNLKVSVRTVPVDKLPVRPVPKNSFIRTVYMFYFNKVGGGTPDQPLPLKSLNDLGLLPGEKAVLWYFDESPIEGEAPNDWAIAGTGTVTPDGKYIASDPGVGIPRFCCGATGWGGQSASTQKSGPETCGGKAGDPVDLATGYFMHEHTDLSIPGVIPINIKRYYRSRESGSAVTGTIGLGAFGKGTYFEYDWWLNTYQSMLLLIKPGNYQYKFPQQQPDGSYINTEDPELRGAKVTLNPDSTKTLRMRDGTIYSFNTFGELVGITDRNGNSLTINRVHGVPDEGGHISSITTTDGKTVTFNSSYVGGNFHQNDSIVDSEGRTVKYFYEADPFSSYPRLKEVHGADGSKLIYGYDSQGRLNSITNGKGVVEVTNVYNSDNRVESQTHPDGGVYSFAYVAPGGVVTSTTMTTPNTGQTTWQFNSYGYITSKAAPDGTTTYQKAAGTNELQSMTDPLSRITSYTYYSTTDARNGLVHTMTDPLGNITTYEYETIYGLPTKITDALGKITNITYTYGANNVITQAVITDPLSHSTTINYNSSGMPSSIIDPNSNTTTFQYENSGRPAELTKIIDPLNNTFKMAYDNLGRAIEITDGLGNSTTQTYDPMSRISSVTDASGFVTRYLYDLKGNLIFVFDAKGNQLKYEYDDRDRVVKMTDQLGREETYTYYRNTEITPTTGDNLKTITDRKGQLTTFSIYDLMNRIKKITYHDNTHTDYTYDVLGRTDYIGEYDSGNNLLSYIDYTYSDFGCGACTGSGLDKISREQTQLGTIDYTYDDDGRRITMTVSGQPVVNYIYDDAGRMTSMNRKINNKTRTYTLTYDNGNRRTQLKLAMSQANKYVTTTYGYDIANRLLSMLIQGPSVQIENLLYEYDSNSNRTKFTRNAVQPVRGEVTSTNYDAANEMLRYNNPSDNMTYDANGNLQTFTNTCGTTTYTWDVRNMLTGISGYKTDCSTLTAAFKYDAVGRRIEKTINAATTKFLYDGLDIIQEIVGTAKTNYIRTLNIDEPLTRIKADGTIRHYVKDALGSIIALTDDSGVVKTTYTYDPFGNVTITGEASDNPFQFVGKENDGTGLIREGFRYYSFDLQRYISEDPIGLAGGDINYYARVGNNPVNFVDPLGLKCKKSFWSRAGENFWLTNKTISGVLAPAIIPGVGVGLLTGGKVAEATGGLTILQWAKLGFRGATLQGVTFTGLETGIIAAGTAATNFALVGLAYETGVGIGSVISAAILPCEEEIEPPKPKGCK